MRKLINWWSVSLAASAVAAVALALVLPVIVQPLRPWWVRLLLIALVGGVWAAFALYRALSAQKASEELARRIAADEAGGAEARLLAKRMNDALRTLRQSGGARDYLYSRPWYVIIGPPASGKSTALLNSGLRFPHEDAQSGAIGGTRNLDFWFSDEAVLVDTAGRYFSQDSDSAVDARGWNTFLELLSRRRPLQPINGVIVAMAVDTLSRLDRSELDRHAHLVRRRLEELADALRVVPPVYVLFTKADLLAGFTEFFDDLDVEGRRAVAGLTLPPDDASQPRLTTAFDRFAQALADRQAKRLHEERDVARRGAILRFPPQLATLRARILRFVEGACPEAEMDRYRLRGLYFTSGVQQGTPIDRLLGSAADVFARQADAPRRGRAYFLNRLMTDVILPEAGRVQHGRASARRRRIQLVGGLCAVALGSVVVTGFWLFSFSQALTSEDRLRAAADAAAQTMAESQIDLTRVSNGASGLEQARDLLDRLRALPGGYDDRRRRHVFWAGGLAPHADDPGRRAEAAYLESLQRVLLPRLVLRLQQVLGDGQLDAAKTYEALKVYLMLVAPKEAAPDTPTAATWLASHMDAGLVRRWFHDDWEVASLAGADNANARAALEQHLDALLSLAKHLDAVESPWIQVAQARNPDLIAHARVTAAAASLVDRAYASLKAKGEFAEKDWRFVDFVPIDTDGRVFAETAALKSFAVPYIYTKAGYQGVYLPNHLNLRRELVADAWVLGPEGAGQSQEDQLIQLDSLVAGRYADDYINHWQSLVALLRPADIFLNTQLIAIFTKPDPPLKVVLSQVRLHTSLGVGVASHAAEQGLARLNPFAGRADRLARAMSAQSQSADAGARITSYFKALNDWTGDANAAGSQLDKFLADVRTATLRTGAGTADIGRPENETAMKDALSELRLSAAGAPPMVSAIASSLVAQASGASDASSRNALSQAYHQDVASDCARAVANRYPFDPRAREDADPAAVMDVFGQAGSFARFDQQYGASGANGSASLTMRQAAELKAMLAAPLYIQVEALGFSGGAKLAEIDLGGSGGLLRFESGSRHSVSWSIQASSPHAELRLLSADQHAIHTFSADGPWAVFRLMDMAKRRDVAGKKLKATFADGDASVLLAIEVSGAENPFLHGGPWAFRCPQHL